MSTTYLLDKFIQYKKIQREELRLTTIDKVKGILKEMLGSIPFKEAYFFGTITKPYRFFEESDVDIAFIGLMDEDFFKASAYLSSRLGKDVDIVQLEDHRWRDKIIKEGIRWMRQD